MQRTLSCPFFRKAFGWCVPIGGRGGLIGAVLIGAASKTLASQR